MRKVEGRVYLTCKNEHSGNVLSKRTRKRKKETLFKDKSDELFSVEKTFDSIESSGE